LVKWLLAIVLAAGPVAAQPAPPQAAANEDPGDVVARVRFERAVRAELEGGLSAGGVASAVIASERGALLRVLDGRF
jgi:hypothetical protein